MCTGGLLLSRLVSRDLGLAALVGGMLVLGVGTGLFSSSVTTVGVTALDPSRAGLAGGIVYMFQGRRRLDWTGADHGDLHHRDNRLRRAPPVRASTIHRPKRWTACLRAPSRQRA